MTYFDWMWALGLADIFLASLAAAETCSLGQVPALNPAKHRLGSTEWALSHVNAQNLTALDRTLPCVVR